MNIQQVFVSRECLNIMSEYSCLEINSPKFICYFPAVAPLCSSSPEVWAEPGKAVSASCGVSALPIRPISFSWVWTTPTLPYRVPLEFINSTVSLPCRVTTPTLPYRAPLEFINSTLSLPCRVSGPRPPSRTERPSNSSTVR